ncbi:O-antigen ligase family protein [Patescibacteria group bacterium]|nr:O-antigen ligase family protein [Patescibacteria group bacterium]
MSIVKNKLRITSYELRVTHIIYVALTLLGLSFLGYFFSFVNSVGFFGFGLFCLVLGIWKREYALYLAFLELCLGSFGYLLSFNADGFNLSLRMLFFVVIMGLWLFDFFYQRKNITEISLLRRRGVRGDLIIMLAIFLFIWFFGILQGYLRGHSIANIFYDANSYLYFLLLLPALTYINTKEKFKELRKVVLTGAGILALGTIVIFLTFTYCKSPNFLEILYKWLRDFRIAEITSLDGGSYRIFLQSQIYLLAGLLILSGKYFFERMKFWKYSALTIIFSAGIYISLSRSLWIGSVAGIIVFLTLTKLVAKKKVFRKSITLILSMLIGLLLVGLIAKGNIMSERLKVGESASNTRIEQLVPLLPAIYKNPVFGYGFGKTLTFISRDPRINGEYTTHAFEWGYLDMILKFGALGLLVYLGFISVLLYSLIKNKNIAGIALIAALLSVHMFTPYLNHPLGIGILLLTFLLGHDITEKE